MWNVFCDWVGLRRIIVSKYGYSVLFEKELEIVGRKGEGVVDMWQPKKNEAFEPLGNASPLNYFD